MSRSDESASPETLKRNYSVEEVDNIYELARFSIENGDMIRAEVILAGLVQAAPYYAPAWLAMSFIHAQAQAVDQAIDAARKALKAEPAMVEAELFLAAYLMTAGDYNAAGTLLGEVNEKIEAGQVDNPGIVRFFRIQMARFESR